MIALGNICLGLASALYLLPLRLMTRETTKRNDGGVLWGAIFVLVPLWLLLTTALCAVTARGGFDWLLLSRPTQYALVLTVGGALLVVTGFSLMGRFEPAAQLPAAARLFSGWAVRIFPPVVIAFVLLALNPKLGASLPPLVFRLPLLAVAALSLLASGGLLVEWVASAQKKQTARIEAAIASDNRRDRDMMARVRSLQPTHHFAELLGFTNRFETPAIRAEALRKAQAHPKFTAALVTELTKNDAVNALVYLDAAVPPDRKPLAEPIRAAILRLAGIARAEIPKTHLLYTDQFDWNTRLILSVAEKFSDEGVDYLPAIREFRAALGELCSRKITFNAEGRLDAWLAQREKARKKP